MTSHFQCTACGKCCYGVLPLTYRDALKRTNIFPLCFIWTPVGKNSADFPWYRKLGTSVNFGGKLELAVIVSPASFVPSPLPCPALKQDNLCGIHDDKPSRCRSMPFYPYREERYQADHLRPRPGWDCDTSSKAPVVYTNKRLVNRDDFDREARDLTEQAPILRSYAEFMLRYQPSLANRLAIAATQRAGGRIITSLSSFLTATKDPDSPEIAKQQIPVLSLFAKKTEGNPDLADFHNHYVSWGKEMTYLAQANHQAEECSQ